MRHARPDYNRIQDPLGLIPEDEPVFLLRGQDMLAPATLQAWIDEAKHHNAQVGAGEDTIFDDPIPEVTIRAVEQLRSAVVLWQRDRKVKIPDSPDEIHTEANTRVDVKVGVKSKALAKIIDKHVEEGADVFDASGLLTALAERAKAEIGAFMVANKHATLSYEQQEDGAFALVGRVFDQKIVVRLAQEEDERGKVIPINAGPEEAPDLEEKADVVIEAGVMTKNRLGPLDQPTDEAIKQAKVVVVDGEVLKGGDHE